MGFMSDPPGYGSNRIQVIGHNKIGCKSLPVLDPYFTKKKKKLVMHAPKIVVRVFISEKSSTNQRIKLNWDIENRQRPRHL